ncbi:TonB-dependent receptor [Spongiibacter tropicus]|uniref:TonB-dependent receptor n=1 Tax=Spongiibacter tropicus TaxID=454602 RepID=UPI0003B43D21|nr:TonB-dependent receptor [Spongiibacter tropicus]
MFTQTHHTLKALPAALLASAVISSSAVAAQLEEVLVTAEKKSASIQDVPMSVAAIAGDDVGMGKVTEMNDVALKTPGMSFTQFNLGEPRVYIRGIGNSSDSAASDSAVGIFIDEIYIGRAGGSGFDLFDLERIEILKGPQGTLYGKNTNGGAINFITSRPDYEPMSKLSFTAGNKGLFHAQALVTGGLTDTIAGKLSVASKQRDGFQKNVIRPSDVTVDTNLSNSPIIGNSQGAKGGGDELGDIESVNVRGQLLFDLSDTTMLLLSADYSKDETNGNCSHLLDLSAGVMGTGALWQAGVDSLSPAYRSNIRNCASQFDTGQEREVQGVSARIEHGFAWADLLSITAWRASDVFHVDDLTSLPLTDINVANSVPENVINGAEESASQFSQEFRLSGTHNNIDWITGIFYMQEDVERDEQFYTRYNAALSGGLGLAPEGNVLFLQDNTTTSLAVYGQADWHVDNWTFTYGLRWSMDEKEITQDAKDLLGTGMPTGVPLILPEFPTAVKGKEDWEEITHKASVNYRFGEDAMVYLTYSEGFKSGAFPSQTNLPENATKTVDPEFVENIEVGLKSTWFDSRLQFNIAYYDIDYDNLQVFELTPTLLLVLNSAQAESSGFETSIALAASERLTLSANYNHGKARYEDFVTAGGSDYSGNQLQWSPDRSGSVDADYTLPLRGGSRLDFNVNYSWKDDYYTAASNADVTKQKSLSNLGVSAGWTSSDESLSVRLWGKNLGDKAQTQNVVVDPTGITSNKFGDPTTYGITVSKTF